MSTPDTCDIAELIKQATEDPPVGPNLKDDAEYFELKSARRTAQRAETKLRDAWEKEGLDEPDWRPLWKNGREFLKRTKDLWAAAWTAEAGLRVEGFAGLRDSFRLIRELIEKYWDEGLQPRPEEGDSPSTLVSQLAGLNDSLVLPIKEVALTGGNRYSLLVYETAREIENESEENRLRRIEDGAVPLSEFDKAVSATDANAFTNLYEDVIQCIEEVQKLSKVMNERCVDENGSSFAPSWSNVEDCLDDCKRTILHIAPHVQAADQESNENEVGINGEMQTVGGDATRGGVTVNQGGVATREDAFKLLERVATFFEQTEPHSPVSYALRKAVRWGKMPLDKWLKEMLNEDSRSEMFKMIGIDNAGSNESQSEYND